MSVPAENVTAPPKEVCLPSEKVTLNADDATIPADDVTVPSDDVTVMSDEVSVLSDEVSVLSDEVSVLSDEVTIASVFPSSRGRTGRSAYGGLCGKNGKKSGSYPGFNYKFEGRRICKSSFGPAVNKIFVWPAIPTVPPTRPEN